MYLPIFLGIEVRREYENYGTNRINLKEIF